MATLVAEVAAFQTRMQTEGVAATALRTPAQGAIAGFAALQAALNATTATIAAVNLGPFPLGGSCDYDCFIGICIHTQHWSWNLDFQGVRPAMQNAVQELSNAANQYQSAFAPARNWLKGMLPQFSGEFTMQAQVIISTNQAILAGGGKPTPIQDLQVRQAFQCITNGLSQGQAAMNAAMQVLDQFTGQLQAIEDNVNNTVSNIQSSIDNSVKNAKENLINDLHCGQGDADNQVNVAVTIFNASVGVVRSQLGQVTNVSQGVTNSLKEFVATLLNISDQYGNILAQIAQAQTYPAGAIQDLHLDIAANEWAQLAQYAAQNIQ